MKRSRILSGILAAALLAAAPPPAEALAESGGCHMESAKAKGAYLKDLYTDKSMYNPGEAVKITAEVKRPEQLSGAELTLAVCRLGETVWEQKLPVSGEMLAAQANLPETDFTGYSLEAYLTKEGELLDYDMSAVDVSSDWNVFPRYGYITKLDNRTDEEIQQTLDRLMKHHINGLFYYDVFDTQEKPLAGSLDLPAGEWKSLAGQTVTGDSLQKTIGAGHDRNMKSFFYNLIFGAYDNYEEKGIRPEWGLYQDDQHSRQDVHDLSGSGWETEKLWMFNPANEEWQDHFVKVHQELLAVYPFDGLQMDTLGNRNAARYDYEGNPVELDQTYTAFLQKLDEKLDTRILFNPVGGYGLLQMLNSRVCDIAYMEVWPGDCKDYLSLKRALDQIYSVTKGEYGSVIAAYMDYSVMKGEPFNEPGIRYTNSVLMASGGSHLELGDTGMLSSEYYPGNSLRIPGDLEKELRNEYSFMVAYENLLRGTGLEEITARTWVNGEPASMDGALGQVYSFAKRKGNTEILHLINFDGASSQAWVDSRGTQTAPAVKEDVVISQAVRHEPERVWMASPDYQEGILQELDFTYEDGMVSFTLPYLEYWDMIVFE